MTGYTDDRGRELQRGDVVADRERPGVVGVVGNQPDGALGLRVVFVFPDGAYQTRNLYSARHLRYLPTILDSIGRHNPTQRAVVEGVLAGIAP